MRDRIVEIIKKQGFLRDNQEDDIEERYIKFINPYLFIEILINQLNEANFLRIIVNNKVIEVDPYFGVKDYSQKLAKTFSASLVNSVMVMDVFISNMIQDVVVEFIRSILQKNNSDEGKDY